MKNRREFLWPRVLIVLFTVLSVVVSQNVTAQRPKAQRPNANRQKEPSNDKASAADLSDAKRSADSATIVLNEGALLVSTIEGFVGGERKRGHAGSTPQQVAAYIASHAGARYSPAGCVTTNLNGTTVTINFNSCTGPRGLKQVTGTVVDTVAAGAAGAIDIQTTANRLQIGQTMMSIDSASQISNANGTRSMTVTTSGSGTGPLGNSISRQGSYTVTSTTTCATIDGYWASTTGDRSRSTVKNISRCNQQCPTGSISHNSGSRTINIIFDGTSTAKWTTSNGKSGTINLMCGP